MGPDHDRKPPTIPVQQALDTALRDALLIQSSSRKNFERDIQAQLQFIPLQISSHFLQPLTQAFRQLSTRDLLQNKPGSWLLLVR